MIDTTHFGQTVPNNIFWTLDDDFCVLSLRNYDERCCRGIFNVLRVGLVQQLKGLRLYAVTT